MSTITRELAKLFRKITNSEIDAEGNAHVVLSPADSLLINNARIALASLEAEPVAWLLSGGGAKNNVSFDSGNAYADPLREVTPLYTAPPAPVALTSGYSDFEEIWSSSTHPLTQDDEMKDFAWDIWNACRAAMLQGSSPPAPVSLPDESAVELLATDLMKRIDKITGERHSVATLSSLRVSIVEACRAAMFQGVEPVTTAYKLRDAVEIIRNSGIEIDAEKIFAERDALNTPDCWCRTCRPVTVTDMRFVVCPECGNKRCPHANDHRNACTGSNEPGQEGSAYPAAPQQEA